MPKLTIQEDYQLTGEFIIPEGETIVGRQGNASLVLEGHQGISRQHCKLSCMHGIVTIEDLGSRNGTFLNGKPLVAPTVLKHHDCIQIDSVLLLFSDRDDAVHDLEKTACMTPSEDDPAQRNQIAFVKQISDKLIHNMENVIQGKNDVIERVIVALLSEGHVLLEDVPGVGKTKLAQALARSMDTDFKRIQFTPDMLPNDITGVNIYDERTKNFTFLPGPIFSNIVLADEINRGTPRVQAALLECMSESAITIDGKACMLHKPFFVIATQNPVDFHGTYPLPEAQLDRFLMRLSLGYPSPETEKSILEHHAQKEPLSDLLPVLSPSDLLHCQSLVRNVFVSDASRDYIVTIITKTREHPAFHYGCSTRASIALLRASQALAALQGRDHVLPRDARDLAPCVLSHRVSVKPQARWEWTDSANVIRQIVESLPMERWEH